MKISQNFLNNIAYRQKKLLEKTPKKKYNINIKQKPANITEHM